MKTYCLACRKHTNNVGSWNTTIINKVIRNKSKCGLWNVVFGMWKTIT